jgi:hypothetical protein
MANAPIANREPDFFTSGDTLLFNRNLPNYLPSAGWSIHLTVTQVLPNAGHVAAQAVSVPDATNAFHTFNVPNFAAGLDAGLYILSEEVVNANTGEKHQIYYNDNFLIGPDLGDGLSSASVKTEAQQMLEVISSTLKDLYKQKFTETDVQRNRFVLQKTTEALNDYKFWWHRRQQEIQFENVRNGRPSGAVSEPVFCIG